MLSRRLALVASLSLAGLVLGACGDAPGRTAAGLPKISLSASGGGGLASADAAGAADEKMAMMPYWNVEYVFEGTMPDLGTEATAYRFVSGGVADTDQVSRIAEAFGLSGDVRELPADQGGGWQVGAADYSGPVLTVGRDGLLSWWFSDMGTGVDYGCAVGSVGATDDAVAPDTAVTPDTTVVCVDPAPPVGVPDAAAAEQLASTSLEAIGVDPSTVEFETYADDWSAWVTAYRLIDGVRSPMIWSFGYGAEARLTSASGVLAEPEVVGDYPIVSAGAGLERLNDDTGRWGWFGGPVFARDAAVSSVAGWSSVSPEVVASAEGGVSVGGGTDAVAPPSTEVVVSGSVVVDPAMPTATIEAPDCLASDACGSIGTVPVETQTITLTDVRLGLTSYWDADGTVWFLPSYEFTNADGGVFTVIAVDEAYLDIPEVPMPEPLPVEPMPGESIAPSVVIDVDAASSALVGLGEDEALKVAAEQGWDVRVAERDGVALELTADYSPQRVNVAVADGVVTAVVSIG